MPIFHPPRLAPDEVWAPRLSGITSRSGVRRTGLARLALALAATLPLKRVQQSNIFLAAKDTMVI